MDVESTEEKKENITEIQTEKPIEIPPIITCTEGGMNFETASMIRRFTLVNTSNFIVYCQLGIFAKQNDVLNFRIPVSIFNAHIKPKSKSCILSLMKFAPSMDWGDYEVKCQIQLLEPPATPPSKSDNDSGRKKGNFQIRPIDLYYAANAANNDGMNFELTDEEFYNEFFDDK